jgi:tetratricopeptide (TPR) repeat protein
MEPDAIDSTTLITGSPEPRPASSAGRSGAPRICLCMIVRNARRGIERCLDAAGPLLDAASICDTGSDDGTPELIGEWLGAHGVPGTVHHHPWRDFGSNRTRAIEAAQQTLQRLGFDRARTYLLFLDAGMCLQIDPAFRRDELHADVYQVVRRRGRFVCPDVRLARASLDTGFTGAVHARFTAPPGTSQASLGSLSIDDHDDDGGEAERLERDLRLLTAEIEREPDNTSTMFHLAQTYRQRGDLARALAWYRRCLVTGGSTEEVWYAHHAIGLMYLQTGELTAAVASLHRAIRLDPERAEPYFALAEQFRSRRRHLLAARYAARGLARSSERPPGRTLLLERGVTHGLLRELSIAGFYTRDREPGFDANERLALGHGTPSTLAALAVDNEVFYAGPLPDATHTPLAPALPSGLVACNPSILRTAGGYLINCRAVTYRMDAYQRYVTLEDGVYRTQNYLMEVDRDLRFVSQHEIRCELPPRRRHWAQGLEDCRLVALGDRLAFTCTTAELHPDGPIRISLVMLDEERRVAHHAPLAGHGDDRIQKNWLPFVDRETGALHVVYAYEPLTVLHVDPASGRCRPVVEVPQGRHFERWHGSAGPIDLPDGGRLLMIHEVALQGRRYYLHRFVGVDPDWRIDRVSRPFFFHHRGVEFAGGATLTHDGADLLVTYGVEDREAWLCRIPLARVLDLLRPL